MRIPLKRYYGQGDFHFITFSCYQRKPFLGTRRARDCFVKELDVVRSRHGFRLIGYVVMPEQVHLLISEPKKGDPSKVLQALKQNVSCALRGRTEFAQRHSNLPFASAASLAPAFWQRRFYDFNVWSEKKLTEKLNYMHANPVHRRLVQHPKDWPWSSWSYYEKGEKGMIRIDVVGSSGERSEKPRTLKPEGCGTRHRQLSVFPNLKILLALILRSLIGFPHNGCPLEKGFNPNSTRVRAASRCFLFQVSKKGQFPDV